jgi:hypothetical protein
MINNIITKLINIKNKFLEYVKNNKLLIVSILQILLIVSILQILFIILYIYLPSKNNTVNIEKEKYYKVNYYSIDRYILNSWEIKGEIYHIEGTKTYYFYHAKTNAKIIIVNPQGTIIAEEFNGEEYK